MSIEEQPSSPERPGQIVIHRDYYPDGTPGLMDVTRADRWVQVARDFVKRTPAVLHADGTLVIGPVRYRFVRHFDDHTDLFERITTADEMGLPSPAFNGPGRAAQKHGPLCTIDTATGQCRSPHCRACGGVADAQGFCSTCSRESGPHADGFRLARTAEGVQLIAHALGMSAAEAAAQLRDTVRQAMASVESPDRPYAAQEAAAEQKRQLPIAAEVRHLLAGVESITTEQLTEHLQREGELATRVDELQTTLTEVLGHFTEPGHPGEPCLRTGWLSVKWVDRWRRVAAGRPSWDQLFALIDVELTPWQQDFLADAWTYHETHGKWPLRLQDRQAGRRTLQAAAAQLLERARAAGWAE